MTDGPPIYPEGTSPGVPEPPQGFDWAQISYVIGGYGWKARFIDEEGYILTGEGRQYNLANPELSSKPHWVAYDGKEHSRKPYVCGSCHTTGWQQTGADGPHQNGLPGIHGTWQEPGVTCEACHGPSADHAAAPSQVLPTTAENCGGCHSRGDVTQIDAKNGLIRHHEQYEALLASPHQTLACGTCHDPHQSTKYQQGGFKGTDKTCETCHADVAIKLPDKKDADCQSCHMPNAVTSALSKTIAYDGGEVRMGDIRAHIHRITLDPDWRMFTDDGKFVRVDSQKRAYLTLDYVCMSCHTDKSIEWAREAAARVH
ncbi:cytochrome c3 family protein [Marinobacter sp. CHS3-4]|uniref:cytochrome c3 family protein n=1 Tax=Marinobacter sp. CHS3-4 TaxID=3045174 RepID=UPI0024B5A423|nr:cytochrome c3 family protein [Marinobacter sp. CHS3-4]MDI9245389.1 cytochrome c3 family protein [Marinobacter sp. CHS3-4]